MFVHDSRRARAGRPFGSRSFWPWAVVAAIVSASAMVVAQETEDEDEEEVLPMEAPALDAVRMRAAPARGMGGSASVSAGGAQDINHARQIIESGGVPDTQALVAEGLLSEHDLPVTGPPCERLFCPLLSTGYAPSFDSERGEVWVQLGFNSNIDLATFERRPLNVAIVLDRSGSMSGEKMEVVRAAALAMLERMGPGDRLALVSYASTAVVDLPSTAVAERSAFERHIRGWATEGSTNLEGALELGYREVARHAGDAEFENRVIVFTDMLPNVGMTGPQSFRELSGAWAREGMNLTVIGVGQDFGQELGLALSELRGGNYYFLRDRDEAARVFGEELDFMVTPVAYDVDMRIETGAGFELTGVYGVPQPEGEAITTHISTLFLSQRGGAILLRFVPSDAAMVTWRPELPIAEVTLSYTTVAGEAESAGAAATFAMPAFEPEAPLFEQPGPYRAWALVQQALVMRAAIENHGAGRTELARAQLGELAGTMRTVAVETGDEPLQREVALVERLLENLE